MECSNQACEDRRLNAQLGIDTMGQYYLVANLDKKEYLSPHRIDSGAKAREWLYSGNLTRLLGILLIDGDGRGGGDVNIALSGRWAKDRIVISGDYADDEPDDEHNVYSLIHNEDWVDITEDIVKSLKKSPTTKNDEWAKKIRYVPSTY